MAKNNEKWMQRAFKNAHGQLHRMLGIPKDEKIPQTLLSKIIRTPIGKVIKNPTKKGKKKIKVTTLLKRRALPVYNANKIRKK